MFNFCRRRRHLGHHGRGLGLSAQGGVQRRHCGPDLLGIATGIGRFQGLGGVEHHAIALAQRLVGLFAFLCLAVEGIVDRLAERVPQLLLGLALHRHALCLGLPAVLQRLHRIDAQHRRGAQYLGLLDHGMATLQTLLLCGLQWRGRGMDAGFPQRLQLGKGFLAEMAGIAPAIRELVQRPRKRLPFMGLGALHIALRPGLELVDQRHALRLVRRSLGLELVEPDFHHLVRFVAGFVETLPQGMVGHAALVHRFPLLTQLAQRFLHLATAHDGHGRRVLALGGTGRAERFTLSLRCVARNNSSIGPGVLVELRHSAFGRGRGVHSLFGGDLNAWFAFWCCALDLWHRVVVRSAGGNCIGGR